MSTFRLLTDHLELRPLPLGAAAALPDNRDEASRLLGAQLDAEWPEAGLVRVIGRHAELTSETERFGIWVMIERESAIVVGDIGFHGPPDEAGTIEVGYSVVSSRRRRGYATEAASALVEWAYDQPAIETVVAGCALENEPSVRTLERVGFQRTGEVNGELRWRHVRNTTDKPR